LPSPLEQNNKTVYGLEGSAHIFKMISAYLFCVTVSCFPCCFIKNKPLHMMFQITFVDLSPILYFMYQIFYN